MTADRLEMESHFGRIRGRETRTQSIATRFTRAEEDALLKKAEASGQTLREWARETLLRGDVASRQGEMGIHIFTELVGIQMLLMNTLEPLLCGEKLTREQVRRRKLRSFSPNAVRRRRSNHANSSAMGTQ
jgi:hypothetical protein